MGEVVERDHCLGEVVERDHRQWWIMEGERIDGYVLDVGERVCFFLFLSFFLYGSLKKCLVAFSSSISHG